MARVHVIGAGLAGLAAAVRLVHRGVSVRVYESANHAGGRCRSYEDEHLGALLDNGNHLMLSGNRSLKKYLRRIGAEDGLSGPDEAVFPFLDVKTGERWTVRPNAGPVPVWPFSPSRRVAGSRAWDYLGILKFLFAQEKATVNDVSRPGSLFHTRFIEPLTVAVLNTPPGEASAALLRPVFMETFLRGAAFCRPLFAGDGLSPALIDPAVAWLNAQGADILFNYRLKDIDIAEEGVRTLFFNQGRIALKPGRDLVLLALPAQTVNSVMPEIGAPGRFHPIYNIHYLCEDRAPDFEEADFLGLIHSPAQWVFRRGDVLSVTVSAADALLGQEREAVARDVWRDVARALSLDPETLPPHRVIVEKRATFAQTPGALKMRKGPCTDYAGLYLAGDWTDTGLPATIEGAIRSGFRAADAIGDRLSTLPLEKRRTRSMPMPAGVPITPQGTAFNAERNGSHGRRK